MYISSQCSKLSPCHSSLHLYT